MKFVTKNSSHSTLHIGYKLNYIGETVNTEFLRLQIDNHLNWKNHIEQMILKLSETCYAVRLMVHISNINTLKSIYYAYIHSLIKYGIIFGSNSAHSGKIFTLQKKIIIIMAGAQPSTSSRNMFKNLEFLPVSCHYILLLMNTIISNQENFQTDYLITIVTFYSLLVT